MNNLAFSDFVFINWKPVCICILVIGLFCEVILMPILYAFHVQIPKINIIEYFTLMNVIGLFGFHLQSDKKNNFEIEDKNNVEKNVIE